MPSLEEKRRGGVKRYRTKKVKGGYLVIAVVPKKGPRGGHTVAKLHRVK